MPDIVTNDKIAILGLSGEIGQVISKPQEFLPRHLSLISEELLQTRIGYGNKEAATVTARDIEKVKNDKKALETDYFTIVSKNLPMKEVKNGVCGEREGIVFAHPGIVVELAKVMRKAIIQISKQSRFKQHIQTKQAKIYDLIRGREFQRHIESIYEMPKKLSGLSMMLYS